MEYIVVKTTVAVLATLGLYSILYRENKFYRLFEHIFLGLASGWALKTLWTDVLGPIWWDKMLGVEKVAGGTAGQVGYWPYVFLLPLGLMGYFVFNKKYNWISRIPIGIILGLYSGQQVQVWWNRFGPQIDGSLKPVIPTTRASFTKPGVAAFGDYHPTADQIATINLSVYPSQAITNIIFIVTLLSVLAYFLFSFRQEGKIAQKVTQTGRWLLMIGFGAIFGSTVMMRFTLLIDRMYFIWIEWFRQMVLHK